MGFYEKRQAKQSFNRKKSTTEKAIDRVRRTHRPIKSLQEQVEPKAPPNIINEY